MCGIFFSAITRSRNNSQHEDDASEKVSTVTEECLCGLNQILLDRLSCRGPDSSRTIFRKGQSRSPSSILPNDETIDHEQSPTIDLTFHSTVLSLRGSAVTSQPITDHASGNILCWNGEAWRIGDTRLEYGESDTEVISDLLQNASKHSQCRRDAEDIGDEKDEIIEALMTIQGPFAFVYFDKPTERLYFGRDCIGRRSLLYKTDFEDGLRVMLSSVGDGSAGWEEVSADGIYVLDLSRNVDKLEVQQTVAESMRTVELDSDQPPSNQRLREIPSMHITHHSYQAFKKYATFNHTPPAAHRKRLTMHSPAVAELETLLHSALTIRVRTIPGLQHENISTLLPTSTPPPPSIAILFSGGLDCTTLARLLHTILPATHSIDLLNVAFHNPHIHKSATPTPAIYASCPDRITALQSLAELQRVCPERRWRLVETNVPFEEAMRERGLVAELMSPKCTEMDLSIAMALFFASRGKGVVRRGVDSSGSATDEASATDGSDGHEYTYTYTTPARILLSGLGADELFAGYARHATAFSRAGFAGLTAELALDVQRLGSRNLGRDDRVVSHWGREVRYPFLDEEVMAWAVGKGVGELCGFGMGGGGDGDVVNGEDEKVEGGRGAISGEGVTIDLTTASIVDSKVTATANTTTATPIPTEEDKTHSTQGTSSTIASTTTPDRRLLQDDTSTIEDGKLVLRLLAYKLGMHQVAREKKRAIQFGARTAKMHGKTSGTAAMMTMS